MIYIYYNAIYIYYKLYIYRYNIYIYTNYIYIYYKLYDIYDIIICSHENNMPLCQLMHFGAWCTFIAGTNGPKCAKQAREGP